MVNELVSDVGIILNIFIDSEIEIANESVRLELV